MADEVRLLIRSMTTPANSPAMTAGIALAEATIPALRALPVAWRMMSGRAIPAMALPSSESVYEAR